MYTIKLVAEFLSTLHLCVLAKAPFSRVYEFWTTPVVFEKNGMLRVGHSFVTWGVAFNFKLCLVRDKHFVKSVWFLQEGMSRRTKICIELLCIYKGKYLKIGALRVGHQNGSFRHTHYSNYRIHNPKQNVVRAVQEGR